MVKYKEIISQHAIAKNIQLKELAYSYVDLIIKSYNYEECLKASSEFDIPLVVLDREYYFKKMLISSSDYGDEIKPVLLDMYNNSDDRKKEELYNKISSGVDANEIIQKYHQAEQSQTFTIQA